MNDLTIIALLTVWFVHGWISHELYLAYRRWRTASKLAATDEILCKDATVVRERTGEIAWYDNAKDERM